MHCIVDADRSIHPSNLGLSGSLDRLRAQTQIGDLDTPPTKQQLADAASKINPLLQRELPAKIWDSTMAADAELTKFCRQLWPSFVFWIWPFSRSLPLKEKSEELEEEEEEESA